MSYLNRFIIEEDIQFECNGVVAFSKKIQFKRFYRKHSEIPDKSKKTIVHLIIAADFGLKHEMPRDAAFTNLDGLKSFNLSHAFYQFLLQLPRDNNHKSNW